ncbi:hypothetical protein K8I28_13610 [bacterium]|nr:hypothetical protein [bacterium]
MQKLRVNNLRRLWKPPIMVGVILLAILLTWLQPGNLHAASASLAPQSHELTSSTNETEGQPPSNSIIDMEIYGPFLWSATGNGVGRFDPNPASDNPAAGIWERYSRANGLGEGGVSGLAIGTLSTGDTVIWAATATDYYDNGESFAAGGGVGFSVDNGETWYWFEQPVDPRDTPANRPLLDSLNIAKPTTTHVLNVTYDIGILNDRVWITSWAGGIRYLDMDINVDPENWEWVNRPPDEERFDVLSKLNHRGFSVSVMPTATDTFLWIGTAGGVNRSTDNGETWQNYSHESDTTISSPSGNFVTAMGSQHTSNGENRLWAATWSTGGRSEYYGVSMTDDYGNTWHRVLGNREEPLRAHNFAFDDSIVYVATDDGLYKGLPPYTEPENWALFPPIYDNISREFAYEPEIFSAAVGFDRLWAGGPAGLAVSANSGTDWRLMRHYPVPGKQGEPDTYAYPNPFSPDRFERVRLQYTLDSSDAVTVEIYDFAMELVARPVSGESRPPGNRNEVWDGLATDGSDVANGVYFYKISGGGKDRWGKIMILD